MWPNFLTKVLSRAQEVQVEVESSPITSPSPWGMPFTADIAALRQVTFAVCHDALGRQEALLHQGVCERSYVFSLYFSQSSSER